MKKNILLFLISSYLFAEKVQITSNNMVATDLSKKATFIKNVVVTYGKSWIHSDKLIVFFDNKNKPTEYRAFGKKVTFEVFDNDNHYQGSGKQLSFFPKKSTYILQNKAEIEDITNKRRLFGKKIIVNTLKGTSRVEGTLKKPVKIIIDMNE